MYHKNIPVSIALVLIGASTMVGAYHIDYDAASNPANDWFTPAQNPGLVICESTGSDLAGMGAGADKVNPNPVPNMGEGGLCYASSQDFATCTFTETLGIVTDGACTYDKAAEKAKKPETQDIWGKIEPVCPTCASTQDPVTGESGDWFIRILSNTRSCDGSWGQTFAYKEVIAYWGGSITNPETGASGHVTFFVNTDGAEGTYNREKVDTGRPMTIHADKTATNCSGNGDSWGIINGTI